MTAVVFSSTTIQHHNTPYHHTHHPIKHNPGGGHFRHLTGPLPTNWLVSPVRTFMCNWICVYIHMGYKRGCVHRCVCVCVHTYIGLLGCQRVWCPPPLPHTQHHPPNPQTNPKTTSKTTPGDPPPLRRLRPRRARPPTRLGTGGAVGAACVGGCGFGFGRRRNDRWVGICVCLGRGVVIGGLPIPYISQSTLIHLPTQTLQQTKTRRRRPGRVRAGGARGGVAAAGREHGAAAAGDARCVVGSYVLYVLSSHSTHPRQ